MHIASYLNGLPRGAKAELAEKIGCTRPQLSLLIAGTWWPDAQRWRRIVEVTEGRVTPNDHLYGPPRTENANGER